MHADVRRTYQLYENSQRTVYFLVYNLLPGISVFNPLGSQILNCLSVAKKLICPWCHLYKHNCFIRMTLHLEMETFLFDSSSLLWTYTTKNCCKYVYTYSDC